MIRRVLIVCATALATTAGTAIPAAPAIGSAASRSDAVVRWYDETAATVTAAAIPSQLTNGRTWAVGWIAAARAAQRAPRRALPRRHFQEAAIATAVHDTLVSFLPTRAAILDAALTRTLNDIPDGRAKVGGVRAGQHEAQRILAEREGDRLDPASINAPYTPPPPAPGVWRPVPPLDRPIAAPWARRGKTFLLGRADRFRPGPPPALGSPRYRTDLAETRAFGTATSSVRTQEQTDTARFWAQSSFTAYSAVLRIVLTSNRSSLLRQTELVALFHTVTVDAQIAGFDAKYHYLWWRPITAIREDRDAPDPAWEPLITTPQHPEYPSGHNFYAGAADEVLARLTGARTAVPITLTSPAAPGVTRVYTAWRQLTRDNINARVWSGIHFRYADTTGARLGRQVAIFDLRRASALFG